MPSDLPSGWSRARLGDLVSVTHGWPFKSEYCCPVAADTPILVSIGNFDYSGGFRFDSTTVRGYCGSYPVQYQLSADDIVLVMTCQTPGGEILGVPARVPDDGLRYLHNQRIGRVVFRTDACLDPGFAYSLFRSPQFNQELFRTASGSKILHTSPSRIEDFRAHLPPLAEQRRIARVLDALDNKTESCKRLSAHLDEVAMTYFSGAFRSLWSEQQESLPFSAVCEILSGRTPSTRVKRYWHGSVPWISVKDLTPGPYVLRTERSVTPDALAETKMATYDANTVVISARGTVGEVALMGDSMSFNQSCFGLRARKGIGQMFLFALTRSASQILRGRSHGSVFSTITRSTFDSLAVALPDLAAIRRYNELADPLYAQVRALGWEVETLRAIRDAILPKLISGKIRVPDTADPEEVIGPAAETIAA